MVCRAGSEMGYPTWQPLVLPGLESPYCLSLNPPKNISSIKQA